MQPLERASNPALTEAIRRRLQPDLASMLPSTGLSDPFATKVAPTAFPASAVAAPEDPFSGLKPFGQIAGGIGDFLGGALNKATQVPVLGGVLQGLGTIYQHTVQPAIGAIEVAAGDPAAKAAAAANYKTLSGDVPSPFDPFAYTRALGAAETAAGESARTTASDVTKNPWERALAGVQSGAQTALENTLPMPGPLEALGALKKGVVAARAGRVAEVTKPAEVFAPPGRVAPAYATEAGKTPASSFAPAMAGGGGDVIPFRQRTNPAAVAQIKAARANEIDPFKSQAPTPFPVERTFNTGKQAPGEFEKALEAARPASAPPVNPHTNSADWYRFEAEKNKSSPYYGDARFTSPEFKRSQMKVVPSMEGGAGKRGASIDESFNGVPGSHEYRPKDYIQVTDESGVVTPSGRIFSSNMEDHYSFLRSAGFKVSSRNYEPAMARAGLVRVAMSDIAGRPAVNVSLGIMPSERQLATVRELASRVKREGGEFYWDTFNWNGRSGQDLASLEKTLGDVRASGDANRGANMPDISGGAGRKPIVVDEAHVANILQRYDAATPETLKFGGEWYRNLKNEVDALSANSGIPAERIAAAAAILSRQTRWRRNRNALYGHITDMINGGSNFRSETLFKVNDDLAQSVLHMGTPAATGPKSADFAANALGSKNAVIDTHAGILAIGKAPGTQRQYLQAQAAFNEAARRRNVTPEVMQASVWPVSGQDFAPKDLPVGQHTIALSDYRAQNIAPGSFSADIHKALPEIDQVVADAGIKPIEVPHTTWRRGEPIATTRTVGEPHSEVGIGGWRGASSVVETEHDIHLHLGAATDDQAAYVGARLAKVFQRQSDGLPQEAFMTVRDTPLGKDSYVHMFLPTSADQAALHDALTEFSPNGWHVDMLQHENGASTPVGVGVALPGVDAVTAQVHLNRLEDILARNGIEAGDNRVSAATVQFHGRESYDQIIQDFESRYPNRGNPSVGEGVGGNAQPASYIGGTAESASPLGRVTEAPFFTGGSGARGGSQALTTTQDLGFNPSKTFQGLEPDVQRLISNEARAAGGFVEQRRGVVPIEETKRAAIAAGADPNFVDTVIRQKPGTAMNAEELRATGEAMRAASVRRKALQDQIASMGGPQHAPTELKAQALLAAVEQVSLQNAFAGARTEAGRSLRILREALTTAVQDRSGSAYDNALNLIGGRRNAEQILQHLQDIWSGPGTDVAKARDTYHFLHTIGSVGFGDKLKELWINSVLSSPITQIINNVGNLAIMLTNVPTRAFAAGYEGVLTVGGKTRPREIFASEVPAYAFGLLRGIPAGAAKGLHIAVNGYDLSDISKFVETGKVASAGAIGGPLGRVIRVPTTLMAAGDAVAKGMATQAELSAQAARIASREGLKGRAWNERVAYLENTPTVQMLDAAANEAKYVTLQSGADKVTAAFMRLRNDMPLGLGTFVVPFVQVPMNIVKRGFEYSPAGVAVALTKSGGERSTALARATIGSAVMVFFAQQMLDGNMTSAAPTNPAEKDAFYRSGKMPYSIKIGNNWVEYQRLEPLLTPVKWMASAYDAFQNGADPSDATLKAVGSITNSLKDASYLSGISSLIDAMSDPSRFGEKALSHILGGFIPYSSALRVIAQSQDPFIRKPEGVAQTLEASLPGVSQNVPPQLESGTGLPSVRQPTQQGPSAIINPIKSSPAYNDPVDVEIAAIQAHGGKATYTGPDLPNADQSSTQQGKFRLQEISGQDVHDALLKLIQSAGYQRMSWDERAKAIDQTRTAARKQASKDLATESRNPLSNPFASTTSSGTNPFAAPTGSAAKPGLASPSNPFAQTESGNVRQTVTSTATSEGIDPILALATAMAESNLRPDAVGDGGHSNGIFQENDRGRAAGRAPDLNPARQTQRFAADVRRLIASGFRGTPGQIAAAVQRPANQVAYAQRVDQLYRSLR